MVGSWRSAGCPERILMVINYNLFYFLFSNLLTTTNPRNSQIKFKLPGIPQYCRESFVCSFCLLGFFPACFWVLSYMGFWREWAFCTASGETFYAPGSFPWKSQWQGFSFEFIHRDTISATPLPPPHPKTSMNLINECDFFFYKSVFLIICCCLYCVRISSS